MEQGDYLYGCGCGRIPNSDIDFDNDLSFDANAFREGYVYIAESPLYEITTKNKTYFAYDEGERQQILEQIGKEKFTLQRSKGLGENEADMMWMTTMNPATRRLIRVTPTNAEETEMMFDLLLGDNLQGRKDYIAAHGNEYMDELDVS